MNNMTDDKNYTGMCMEVAGIESCGLGFSAPKVDSSMEESEDDCNNE